MQEITRAGLPLRLIATGATDIGQGRKHNEDTVMLRADLHLYVLADGAGGHNAGNVASTLATTSIANYLESTRRDDPERPELDSFGMPIDARRLVTAIQVANRDIIEIAATSNKRKGMGSTVVAALFVPDTNTLHVAHVGDSRCYRLRDGRLEQLTFDHSLINDVLELKPDMDEHQLARLPRHVVTRALGMEDPVRVSVRTHQIAPGDQYLLCSDGLTDALGNDEIADILRLPKSVDDLVKLLIEQANAAGAQDNIAALVVACETGSGSGSIAPRRARTERPPRSARPARREPPASDDPVISLESAPEIEIVMLSTDAADTGPELDWESPIQVLPVENPNTGVLDALEDFWESAAAARALEKKQERAAAAAAAATAAALATVLTPAEPSEPAQPPAPAPAVKRAPSCPRCGEPVEPDAAVCANCGARRDQPDAPA